jgi:hypothetical protein
MDGALALGGVSGGPLKCIQGLQLLMNESSQRGDLLQLQISKQLAKFLQPGRRRGGQSIEDELELLALQVPDSVREPIERLQARLIQLSKVWRVEKDLNELRPRSNKPCQLLLADHRWRPLRSRREPFLGQGSVDEPLEGGPVAFTQDEPLLLLREVPREALLKDDVVVLRMTLDPDDAEAHITAAPMAALLLEPLRLGLRGAWSEFTTRR